MQSLAGTSSRLSANPDPSGKPLFREPSPLVSTTVSHTAVREQDVAGAAMQSRELPIVLQHLSVPDGPPAVRSFAWRTRRKHGRLQVDLSTGPPVNEATTNSPLCAAPPIPATDCRSAPHRPCNGMMLAARFAESTCRNVSGPLVQLRDRISTPQPGFAGRQIPTRIEHRTRPHQKPSRRVVRVVERLYTSFSTNCRRASDPGASPLM